jgi:hypothetical protein
MGLSNAYPYDFVEICWLDASGETDWKPASEIQEVHTAVSSFGFIIRKTRKHYLIGASLYYDTAAQEYVFGDRNHIPRGMIKSVRILFPKNTSVSPDAPATS